MLSTQQRKIPYNKREAKQSRKALFQTVTASRLDNVGPVRHSVPPDSSGTDNLPATVSINGQLLPTREALAKMMIAANLDNIGPLHPGDSRVEMLARQHRHSHN